VEGRVKGISFQKEHQHARNVLGAVILFSRNHTHRSNSLTRMCLKRTPRRLWGLTLEANVDVPAELRVADDSLSTLLFMLLLVFPPPDVVVVPEALKDELSTREPGPPPPNPFRE